MLNAYEIAPALKKIRKLFLKKISHTPPTLLCFSLPLSLFHLFTFPEYRLFKFVFWANTNHEYIQYRTFLNDMEISSNYLHHRNDITNAGLPITLTMCKVTTVYNLFVMGRNCLPLPNYHMCICEMYSLSET